MPIVPIVDEKLQTYIALYTLHFKYLALSNYVRALLPLKSLIKAAIDNLGIDIKNLKFVSSSTVYDDNNGDIIVATSTRMTPTQKQITAKYHWFRQQVGNKFVIPEIESENLKADIFTTRLQDEPFSRIKRLLCSWQAFR